MGGSCQNEDANSDLRIREIGVRVEESLIRVHSKAVTYCLWAIGGLDPTAIE